MTPNERRTTLALAGIFSTRLLGLFMILPTFSLYAQTLKGASATRVGLAIGIYGLTQALFQLPFGILSDRFGRKRIITLGLILFALGSLMAAFAHSIDMVILGRALQGSGAIGSSLFALMADLTREEQRSKSMAIIGMTIGLSFSVALILGPMISHYFNLSGIFILTACLAGFGIFILGTQVPTPLCQRHHQALAPQLKQIKSLLKDPRLFQLNFGIFAQHASLAGNFMAIPILLAALTPGKVHPGPLFYLSIIGSAFLIALPIIWLGHRRKMADQLFQPLIFVLILAQSGLWLFHNQVWLIALDLVLFFIAFNVLEAELPAKVSKLAPKTHKGAAMGLYSSSQFLGIFCGGALGGLLYAHWGAGAVFALGLGLSLFWFTLGYLYRTDNHQAIGPSEKQASTV